jgi:hypothetical protein
VTDATFDDGDCQAPTHKEREEKENLVWKYDLTGMEIGLVAAAEQRQPARTR